MNVPNLTQKISLKKLCVFKLGREPFWSVQVITFFRFIRFFLALVAATFTVAVTATWRNGRDFMFKFT